MSRIAVIGSGAMGSGIAQVAAMAGHEVILFDSWSDSIIRARDNILLSLQKLSEKGKLSDEDAKAIFGRIYFMENMESIEGSSLVIEAVPESEEVKRAVFTKVESLVDRDAIIATNTSSLSVTGLAGSLNNPDRFIGIHFFNPPVLMKLVEVIPALQTTTEVKDRAAQLVRSWGKTTVIASDTPGFIVNRIARPYYSEALQIASEGLASYADIDHAMKTLGGFRMGPFELMDFIGNDVNEAVTRSVWTATNYEPRYAPSFLQVNLVQAGWYGRKSGRGYYNHNQPLPAPTMVDQKALQDIFERILVLLIHEAADAQYYGIASKDDIELAMTLGVNYPKGLLHWADEIGIDECVKRMDALFEEYRMPRYRASVLLRRMMQSGQRFFE